jgi:hypothetical protein
MDIASLCLQRTIQLFETGNLAGLQHAWRPKLCPGSCWDRHHYLYVQPHATCNEKVVSISLFFREKGFPQFHY